MQPWVSALSSPQLHAQAKIQVFTRQGVGKTLAGSGNVDEYKIAASGTLGQIGSFSTSLVSPDWVSADPIRNVVAITDKGASKVHARATSNCVLTSGNSRSIGSQALTNTIWVPATQCVYVPDKGSNQVHGYFMWHAAPKILTFHTSGFPHSTGSQPQSVTVWSSDPPHNNGFMYIADSGSDTISGYNIDTKCGFNFELPGQPFGTGSGPTWVAVGPKGKFAYVANRGENSIWEYRIDGQGSLTHVGSPVPTGATPVEIVIL